MLERSNSCTVILLVSFRLFIHKEHRFHSRDGRTFVQLLLLLFLGLFTELEHCPTHVLLSFLVQKVQNLEISMPAQCHYFDKLLLTMIKREHFFYSTAVDLYQCLFRYVRNKYFRGVLLS